MGSTICSITITKRSICKRSAYCQKQSENVVLGSSNSAAVGGCDAGTEDACVRDTFELLIGSGVCVTMDMNDRFPLFRSDLKNRFRRSREKECYVPTLEEYAEPFIKTGFEVVRKDHFCWIPHSSGPFLAATMRRLSPILNRLVPGRAMRSLVIARKPSWPSSE